MIWKIDQPQDMGQLFIDAGPIDQTAIDRYLQAPTRRVHTPGREGVARYYYLLRENPCVTLLCMGMPLSEWQGSAMVIVGTRQILGEFAGNRHLSGRKGLQLKMQPWAWMRGAPNKQFGTGAEALAEISEQILDLDAIERAQSLIAEKYHWKGKS